MFTVDIYWNDLSEKAKKEILEKAEEHFGDTAKDIFPGNYDVFPMAVLEIEDTSDVE